jgi:hypothetical protein
LDLVRDPIASVIPSPLLTPAIFISSSEDVERIFFLRLLFVESQLSQRAAVKIKFIAKRKREFTTKFAILPNAVSGCAT